MYYIESGIEESGTLIVVDESGIKSTLQPQEIELDLKPLKKETTELIQNIINSSDVEELKDLTYLFSINNIKKNILRKVKIDDLFDSLTDQAMERVENFPEEISNAELLKFMDTAQQSLDRLQKSADSLNDKPMIQINNNTQNINLDNNSSQLSADSKERIINAVKGLIELYKEDNNKDNIIEVEVDNK